MGDARGSRSGRTAWQFIQDLTGRLGKPLDMPDKALRLVAQFLKSDPMDDCLAAIRLDAFSLSRHPLRTEAERKCHACDRRCAPHN